jgi:hypothetical protein
LKAVADDIATRPPANSDLDHRSHFCARHGAARHAKRPAAFCRDVKAIQENLIQGDEVAA